MKIISLLFSMLLGLGDGLGPFLSVAHVQGIGNFAQDSGGVAPASPVSAPVTIILLGLGLLGVAGISMKLRKK